MTTCHHWLIKSEKGFKINARSVSRFQLICEAKSLNCDDKFLMNASISKMPLPFSTLSHDRDASARHWIRSVNPLKVSFLWWMLFKCCWQGLHLEITITFTAAATWNTTPHKILNLIDAIRVNRNYSELITKSVWRRVMPSNQIIRWTSQQQSPLILCFTQPQKLSPHW